MQLIMENWRQYSNKVNNDRQFNLILEKIEQSNNEQVINETVEAWLFEQEQILNEIEAGAMVQKGMGYIDRKINDFMISFYFKATNVIKSIVKTGLKFASPAIKVLKFIVNKVGSFAKRHPVIARICIVLTIAVVMLCAEAVFNTAAAAPTEEGIALTNKVINILQGVLADQMTDIGNISGVGQDLLPTNPDPEIKARMADAINALEKMSGQDLGREELIDGAGKAGKQVETALNLFQNLLKNPPEGFDDEAVRTAYSKWENAGEAIESAHYSFSKIETGTSSFERERLGFSGPGFPKSKE